MNREDKRHDNVINKINSSNIKQQLPNVSFNNILDTITNLISLDDKSKLKDLAELLDKGYSFKSDIVRRCLIIILLNNFNLTEEEITNKYIEIINNKKINNLLYEIQLRNQKIIELDNNDKLNEHNNKIKQINLSFDIKDLPKVGLSELNKELLYCVNNNEFNKNIKTSEIKELTNAYLNKESFEKIKNIIKDIVSKQNINDKDKLLMKEQIIASLILNNNIEYIVEEIDKKELRKTFIYKNDHEIAMNAIKEAKRISQLPNDLTISALTSYLVGNSTIYPNDNRLKSENIKTLVDLLLKGYTFDSETVKIEINNICKELYSDKENASELLLNKFKSLPKTYYLVDEINYSLKRTKEFIKNSSNEVNIYFIENLKPREAGGKFYNCYLSRKEKRNLQDELPSDLSTIIPPKMDIDAIEWYMQEHYDPTFKLSGGIILKLDETIGNVTIFRPNDGKIGIDPVEKEKLDSISNLDNEIDNKKKELEEIKKQLEESKNEYSNINNEIENIISTYEKKALDLQNEMIENINNLKNNYKNQKVKELKK